MSKIESSFGDFRTLVFYLWYVVVFGVVVAVAIDDDTYAQSQEDPEANLRVSSWTVLFFHLNDLHVKDRDIRKLVLHRYLCEERIRILCSNSKRERTYRRHTRSPESLSQET